MQHKKAVRAHPAPAEPSPNSQPPLKLRPGGNRFMRWVGTIFILLHFTAILTAASSVGPTSGLAFAIWKPFQPYLQTLYLNLGYSFYAPEPSPTTLVEYEVERSDGSVVRGRIDYGAERSDGSVIRDGKHYRARKPRLLYHRYLLLTEHIGYQSPILYMQWYKSYARHLCHKYGGSRVGLTLVVHYPATTKMICDGKGMDEEFSYTRTFVGDFLCNEL